MNAACLLLGHDYPPRWKWMNPDAKVRLYRSCNRCGNVTSKLPNNE